MGQGQGLFRMIVNWLIDYQGAGFSKLSGSRFWAEMHHHIDTCNFGTIWCGW